MSLDPTAADVSYRFIEALDVLILRGNQLFGDPGSYGESLMPPWPSVAAGAIRSRLLADAHIDLAAFASGAVPHAALGTPDKPGSFRLQGFQLARQRQADERLEMLFPLPADLVVSSSEQPDGHPAAADLFTLHPTALHPALNSSFPLPRLPVLMQQDRSKPSQGWWLRQSGWQKYLNRQDVAPDDLVHASHLWSFDDRIGIGLEPDRRSAADGRLFTTRAVAPLPGVGFVVAISGAHVPETGLLRFGGDGRAARLSLADISWPEPDYDQIAALGRCRIVLTSPGIFPQGWRLPGLGEDDHVTLPGFSARLTCAAVHRAETISGWDIARQCPKSAQRAASAGSVYWLEALETTPDALRKLAAAGLWGASCEDTFRRAEGFNCFSFALS